MKHASRETRHPAGRLATAYYRRDAAAQLPEFATPRLGAILFHHAGYRLAVPLYSDTLDLSATIARTFLVKEQRAESGLVFRAL